MRSQLFKIIKPRLQKYGLHIDCRGITNEMGFTLFIMKMFQKYEKKIHCL